MFLCLEQESTMTVNLIGNVGWIGPKFMHYILYVNASIIFCEQNRKWQVSCFTWCCCFVVNNFSSAKDTHSIFYTRKDIQQVRRPGNSFFCGTILLTQLLFFRTKIVVRIISMVCEQRRQCSLKTKKVFTWLHKLGREHIYDMMLLLLFVNYTQYYIFIINW